MKKFKNLFLVLMGLLLILNLGAAGSVGAVTVLDIGFEESEGYTTGNLYGQNSWDGDNTAHIRVGNNIAKTGTQSLELNGSWSAAESKDKLSFNTVSGEFTWAFSIHESDYYTENGYYNGTDNFIRLKEHFPTYERIALYLRIDGFGYNGIVIYNVARNASGNLVPMLLIAYDDHSWHDITIVGNIDSDTFDFYFDDVLVSQDNAFMQEVDHIDIISVGSTESNSNDFPYQIYIDDIKLSTEPIPPPGAFADAGPDKIICNEICDKVVFDSRKSYDANGEIVSYVWELDHDGLCDKSASGETPTVTELCPGTYNVTLTITDNDGFTDTDEMVLTVLETCDPCSIMQGDFDSDVDVDGDDLRIFSGHFGTFPLTP